MPLNSTDFNEIFNIAPSGHVETIQNVIKDTSPSQEHPNHHQLQPKIYKCHQSLRGFLMPSNSSDFNEILNIAPSGHMQTIQNVIKDTSPSQEHPQSSSTPAKTPEMSSIFERVLGAFKLNRFQPNFKYSLIWVHHNNSKCDQGHQPQSWMSIIIINSSKNSCNVIDLWKGSWNQRIKLILKAHWMPWGATWMPWGATWTTWGP